MTHSSHVDQTLEEFLAIDWRFDPSRAESHRYLLREHFRRMALWSKALNCTDRWPYFDAAELINPTVRVEADKLERLRNHLKTIGAGLYLTLECQWFLQWAAIENTSEVRLFGIPAPYEPILVMYRRGGWFHIEHG